MSSVSEPLLRNLISKQNRDGGWSYGTGTSWTEPTCYSLLALQAWEVAAPALSRGREWLLRQQRTDGGWPPQVLVPQSTWVTSLASLVLADDRSHEAEWRRSLEWLDRQVGQSSSSLDRLRSWLFREDATSSNLPGWSWVPGTASWVSPTAMAIVALSRDIQQSHESRHRIDEGRGFLLSRRCADGGWNHGGTLFRSEAASSYPETTGMALVGLQGISKPALVRSLDFAESMLPHAGSVEGASWLRIGLASQGRHVPATAGSYPCRTTIDSCLRLLAEAAQNGRNVFALRAL